jgi:molecular chaperone Hsp33
MKSTDSLQRFMFEHASIRGEIVHLETSYQTILSQHPYPPMVKYLLGEALMSCALLTGSIQFEGEISLQFHGDARLPLLLIQCDHHLNIRGYAKYQADHEAEAYAHAFLEGKMTLNINQYNQTESYQSVVPLQSTSMAENLMHYFAQSEQIATRVWLATDESRAAGMLLQLMPTENTQEREQFWEYAVELGETIKEEELLNLDNETILHRLYHETELRLYPARTIHFRCRCSLEKMKQVLAIVGEKELLSLLKEKGQVDVNCDFCNKHYTFDPIDITLLFKTYTPDASIDVRDILSKRHN